MQPGFLVLAFMKEWLRVSFELPLASSSLTPGRHVGTRLAVFPSGRLNFNRKARDYCARVRRRVSIETASNLDPANGTRTWHAFS